MSKTIAVTLERSHIGRPKKHRDVLLGLGLNKMHKVIMLKDTKEIRGMLNKISHMIKVQD
jgi:large subunit ribosomal protein L30